MFLCGTTVPHGMSWQCRDDTIRMWLSDPRPSIWTPNIWSLENSQAIHKSSHQFHMHQGPLEGKCLKDSDRNTYPRTMIHLSICLWTRDFMKARVESVLLWFKHAATCPLRSPRFQMVEQCYQRPSQVRSLSHPPSSLADWLVCSNLPFGHLPQASNSRRHMHQNSQVWTWSSGTLTSHWKSDRRCRSKPVKQWTPVLVVRCLERFYTGCLQSCNDRTVLWRIPPRNPNA